jgi:NAD(P)-dependent dehydrogenase (short-subunit alcohol dehydrogenase family)
MMPAARQWWVKSAALAARLFFFIKTIEMSLADWRRQTAVNLDGVFLSGKYAVPAMRRAGGGSIVIMSSVAGLRGSAGLGGYCATKGGVRLFAKAGRHGMRSGRRWYPDQYSSSRRHRHAD